MNTRVIRSKEPIAVDPVPAACGGTSTGAPLMPARPRPGWMRQFARPEGLLGRLVGHLMALKNAPINEAAAALLDPRAPDTVLEIGFGPGVGLGLLAQRARMVTGLDVSAVMVRQAARRNRHWVAAGRMRLHEASVERVPYEEGAFDAALAVNNFHIWADRRRALAELRRVIKPGGKLLIVVRMAARRTGKYQPPGLDETGLQRAGDEITAAGFDGCAVTRRQVAGREIAFIQARR